HDEEVTLSVGVRAQVVDLSAAEHSVTNRHVSDFVADLVTSTDQLACKMRLPRTNEESNLVLGDGVQVGVVNVDEAGVATERFGDLSTPNFSTCTNRHAEKRDHERAPNM